MPMRTMRNISRAFNRLKMWQKVVLILGVMWLLGWFTGFVKFEGFDGGAPRGMEMMGAMSGDTRGKPAGTLECTMYYTDWCPHCKSVKPDWEKLAGELNGKVINGNKVIIAKVNCEEHPEVAKAQNIEGYPTFKFNFNGKDYPYEHGRSYDEFKRFIQSVAYSDRS